MIQCTSITRQSVSGRSITPPRGVPQVRRVARICTIQFQTGAANDTSDSDDDSLAHRRLMPSPKGGAHGTLQ